DRILGPGDGTERNPQKARSAAGGLHRLRLQRPDGRHGSVAGTDGGAMKRLFRLLVLLAVVGAVVVVLMRTMHRRGPSFETEEPEWEPPEPHPEPLQPAVVAPEAPLRAEPEAAAEGRLEPEPHMPAL